MIVPRMLVCSSFLISVCMFIVCMFIAHIECYSDCSRMRRHFVEPLYHDVVYCV